MRRVVVYKIHSSRILYEYDLNKEFTEKKELKLDFSSFMDSTGAVYSFSIKNIETSYIYFSNVNIRKSLEGEFQDYSNLRCSLETYKCELVD